MNANVDRIPPNHTPNTMTLRRQLFPTFILIVGFLLFMSALLVHSARRQNDFAMEASRHIAGTALMVVQDETRKFAMDYSIWDATVENVVVAYDADWADDNIGTWAVEGLGMHGAIAVGWGPDGQDRVINHADADGGEHFGDPDTLPDGLKALIEEARREPLPSPEDADAVIGYFQDSMGIYLGAAAPIRWEDDTAPPLDNGKLAVLVFYKMLDETLLGELEHRFLLQDLHIENLVAHSGHDDTANIGMVLESADGVPIGNLTWKRDRPGTDMLHHLAVPMVIGLFVLLSIFAVIVHRANRSLKLVHDYQNGLEARTMDLVDARNAAEAANRAKSRFLAMMSHELRTPLNAIIGFSDMLRQEGGVSSNPERVREYSNDIFNSGGYLLALINDILDMSKIEAARYELYEERIHLLDLVDQCVTLIGGLAKEKTIAIRTAAENTLIVVDARALKQILVNLLSNSIKYSEPKTTIRIDTCRYGNGDLGIRVHDQGAGMSPEEITTALQPFGQSKDAHVRNTQGTGLGLNISKALIELHQGTMSLSSAPGKGTTVTIRLPAVRVIAEDVVDESGAAK
ncbi:hypothetical protein HH303_11195 [Rhodospirillaceae bacterium KN72]|uniref:histidine kinase n=1 Tax=Pacificispira spongiicola TaxID=2729598 RepID=A0A7Y0E239_9PROT|nr:ATP-binding protein [Pacificispira spongiicola]NMM45046.1 hypothetical protein [Pacificispira spongiicola]